MAVPAERVCSIEYRIGGAVVDQPEAGNQVHIALVLAFDAERNGRWIAVPVHP
jgi:hypothetical protein